MNSLFCPCVIPLRAVAEDSQSMSSAVPCPKRCLLTSSHPDYDIIIAIRWQMHRYPRIQWKAHHIQGHQDAAKAYSELNLWEKLNVECDTRAKSWWRHCVDSPNSTGYPPQISVQNAPWAVLIGDQLVTKDLKSALRDHCSGTALKAYWTKRQHFGQGTAEDIDWDSSETALKGMTQGQKREFIKHIFHWGITPGAFGRVSFTSAMHVLVSGMIVGTS